MSELRPEPAESGRAGGEESKDSRRRDGPPWTWLRDSGLQRRSVVRVAALLVLLIAVTGAGIAIGRAVEPSASIAATTTAATAATHSRTKPVNPHAAGRGRWGPLPVHAAARFAPGGARAGAALTGKTLVVAGGAGSSRVLAGGTSGPLVRVASLPGPRAAPQVFAIGRTVFVVGGEAGSTPTDAILRLDPATHRPAAAGTFVEPLAEAGVAARGGSAYLVGGWTGTQYATAVLRFTPPDTIDLVTRLPVGVRSPAVLLMRHTLYVAGGRTKSGVSRRVYAVDVGSGAVTALGDLPRAVEQAVLVAYGTKLYLLGGESASGRSVATVVRIDPATGRPSPAGTMAMPLAGASAVPTAAGTLVVDPPAGRVYRVG
jgi:hypothetical protein